MLSTNATLEKPKQFHGGYSWTIRSSGYRVLNKHNAKVEAVASLDDGTPSTKAIRMMPAREAALQHKQHIAAPRCSGGRRDTFFHCCAIRYQRGDTGGTGGRRGVFVDNDARAFTALPRRGHTAEVKPRCSRTCGPALSGRREAFVARSSPVVEGAAASLAG